MFTSPHVKLHLSAASLHTETINEVTSPVFAVRLALEPLTPKLARELGEPIAEHCFTRQGKIRPEMTKVEFRIRIRPQSIAVRMAEDVVPNVVLRRVRIAKLIVQKRGELKGDEVAKKGKKIAPQSEVLRATIQALIDPAEREQREFLCGMFGSTMFYSFEAEEGTLPFDGVNAPEPDEDAGDVLDEQRELKLAASKKPRLKGKGKKHVNGSGAPAEA